MPSLRSVKDASGRATMRRQMKRVEMPDVPNVPGLQEELNRRRSRHLSNGQIVDLPLDPLSHANTQIQTFGNSALEYYAPRAASVAGSSSRASSSCADHSGNLFLIVILVGFKCGVGLTVIVFFFIYNFSE